MANFFGVWYILIEGVEVGTKLPQWKCHFLKNRDFVKKISSDQIESKCCLQKSKKLELRLNNFTNSIKIKVLRTLGHIFEDLVTQKHNIWYRCYLLQFFSRHTLCTKCLIDRSTTKIIFQNWHSTLIGCLKCKQMIAGFWLANKVSKPSSNWLHEM